MDQLWDVIFDKTTKSILKASDQMDSNLLITGSTGTGKSFLAKCLHSRSEKRQERRWQAINLATLSEHIIESELFGHERGAFTSADSRRVGRLENCNGGVVFLDEIGELSTRLQAKLLDFIQYKKITPVGSNREIYLNVRIIAATNRDLKQLVAKREFREDLYHRLNVFHVRLKDLKENPESILPYAKHLMTARLASSKKKITHFSSEAVKLMQSYSWPGNVRELENAIEFGIAMEESALLQPGSFPEYLRAFAETQGIALVDQTRPAPRVSEVQIAALMQPHSLQSLGYHEARRSFEKFFLEEALRMNEGQINLTSRRTGLNKVSLANKIRKYQIDWKSFRNDFRSHGG